MTLITTEHSLKSIRETLCIAQTFINLSDQSNKRTHSNLIRDLISNIDEQRPLGYDSKHDNRHTPTCGCDDK